MQAKYTLANTISIINAGIKHKKTNIVFKILKKHINLLQLLTSLGYITYTTKKNDDSTLYKHQIINCNLLYSFDLHQNCLLKNINILSKPSRRVYTHKHTKIFNNNINSSELVHTHNIIQTSKKLIPQNLCLENNVGGLFFINITV